jgi:hypothetical protein
LTKFRFAIDLYAFAPEYSGRSLVARPVSLRAAVAAAALLLAALIAPAPSAAAPPSRAAIVFLPGPPPGADPPMIERLAAIPGLSAVGFVSSTQGAYTPTQVLLDISAGTRVTTSLYDGQVPPVRFAKRGRGGRMVGWEAVLERADSPPADIDPGALGGAVRNARLSLAYVGRTDIGNREAVVAADRGGGVARAALYEPGAALPAVLRMWRNSRFVTALLPIGGEGRKVLDGLLAARRPDDLVLVVQQPRAPRRRLLAAAAAGLAGGTTLRSDSARTDGLVLTTDIAPTVLERLGVPIPDHVSGEAIEAAGDATAAELDDRRARIAVVGPRRWPITLGGLGIAIALLVVWALVRRTSPRQALRLAGRLGLPAALWLPSVLLVTAALAPSAVLELLIVAFGCAALAIVSDRLLPWPWPVALAAGVTTAAHLIDLAVGSDLIARSLLGPNPLLGARFYGIGNELEASLSAIALLGIGAAVASAPARVRVAAFAAGGGALALLLGWGRLGADVGAVLTLGVGAAAGALAAADTGPGRARAAAILAVPAIAIGLLAALDLATGGDSHFTRSVLRAGGLRELGEVAQRRFELSYTSLGRGAIGPLVLLAVAALAAGFHWRSRIFAPIARQPGLVAGIWATFAAVLTGALTNDSGPIILLIGTTYLALAVGFAAAGPKSPAGRPAVGSSGP